MELALYFIKVFFHCVLPIYAQHFQQTHFEQTTVYLDRFTCQTTEYYNLLQTQYSSTIYHCFFKCSATTHCRRIMFDRKTKLCLMFESGENCFHHENIEDKVCYRLKSLCSNLNCQRCPIGYYGDTCQHIIQDCSDGNSRNVARKASLISYMQPTPNGKIVEAKCNFDYGGITLFQLRESLCDPVDFNRNWVDYVNGFGHIHSEYWLGLKHVYDMLQNYPAIALQVNFQFDNRAWQGYFNNFYLTDHDDGYKFSAGSYNGPSVNPIGNSLTVAPNSLEGQPFSTYDKDVSGNDCPNRFKGGFWFMNNNVCSRANPNGRRNDTHFESSLFWLDDLGDKNDFTKVQLRLNRL